MVVVLETAREEASANHAREHECARAEVARDVAPAQARASFDDDSCRAKVRGPRNAARLVGQQQKR